MDNLVELEILTDNTNICSLEGILGSKAENETIEPN